jgi:1-acyl-sn-glycerol-3-phosphate acyltransferase
MSEIYESNFLFTFAKKYVSFTLKRFYSEFIVIGKENIPHNVPVIFAPNHNNALMDALAIHSAVPANFPIVFLARSDLFKSKIAARILKFCKMLPAFRMRDGVENLSKNNAIFKQCVDILDHKKALGIMPEANQGEQRKLRPLVKGIFRIAFEAQKKFGTNPEVKIIPVGIDYGDFVKSQKHIIVSFGKPIEVSEYMTGYDENSVAATNEIRNRLKDALNNQTLNLATETYYNCFETVVEIANRTFQNNVKLPKGTVSLFLARQKIAAKLIGIEKNAPDIIKKLEEISKEYRKNLHLLELKTPILENAPYKPASLLLESIYLIFTSGFFLVGWLLNILPFFLPVFVRKFIFKTQYTGFFSSIHYGLGLIFIPLFYLLQTYLVGSLTNVSTWMLLLFFCCQYPLGKFALSWYRDSIKFLAKLKCFKLRYSALLNQTQDLRLKIIEMIKS